MAPLVPVDWAVVLAVLVNWEDPRVQDLSVVALGLLVVVLDQKVVLMVWNQQVFQDLRLVEFLLR